MINPVEDLGKPFGEWNLEPCWRSYILRLEEMVKGQQRKLLRYELLGRSGEGSGSEAA